MGNMKTFWIFGFEWWGGLRTAQMRTADGVRFIPLAFGLWVRREGDERKRTMSDNWWRELIVGDTVYIRKPWLDGVHPGGELHKGKVSEIHESGNIIVVSDTHPKDLFHAHSGRANFNTRLEKPTKDILAEYQRQHSKNRKKGKAK